jgi:hypothetical protein
MVAAVSIAVAASCRGREMSIALQLKGMAVVSKM